MKFDDLDLREEPARSAGGPSYTLADTTNPSPTHGCTRFACTDTCSDTCCTTTC